MTTWEKTVMKEWNDIYDSDLGQIIACDILPTMTREKDELEQYYYEISNLILTFTSNMIKRQAEISFKAGEVRGRTEVVEWIEEYEHCGLKIDGYPVIKDHIIIPPKGLKIKIKEWGL